jgi:hypothetical protein
MEDMIERDRGGSRYTTVVQREEIRRRYLTQFDGGSFVTMRQLAEEYGITRRAVGYIVNGRGG